MRLSSPFVQRPPALRRQLCRVAGAPRNPNNPCLTSGPTFVTLRPWKRTLSASASDSGPTRRRAKSDFLSVKAISYQSATSTLDFFAGVAVASLGYSHPPLRVHRGGEAPAELTCAESLSASSHHPGWFSAVIDAFRRNIADHSARVGNLAEAELCIHLLSMAYASQAHGARPQRLPAPLAAGTQAAPPS